MKFIFKRLRRHWQSLRCLITPFPSASRKAVRKAVDWEASYGRTRGLFGSWWGRKSPLVRHQAECWTVWYTFPSAANRNIVKKPPWPGVAHGTCQLHLSHNSVATDGHFYQEHAWWILQNRPKGLSVTQSCKDSESQGRLSIVKMNYDPGRMSLIISAHFPISLTED